MINSLFRQPAVRVHVNNLTPFNIALYVFTIYLYITYNILILKLHVFFSKMEDNKKRMGFMVEHFERNGRE